MPDGLAWIADAWHGVSPSPTDLYLTCARGLDPRQLAVRMADHRPVEFGPALTREEASCKVDLSQVYCVGRIGRSGDWSFVVESGGSDGWALDPAVSLGAEVLILDPPSADPACHVRYLADGEVQLHFACGPDYAPVGTRPDLLRPALEAAGFLTPHPASGGPAGPGADLSAAERTRRALTAVGEHFQLSLPRQAIEHDRLPAVITRTSPPSSW